MQFADALSQPAREFEDCNQRILARRATLARALLELFDQIERIDFCGPADRAKIEIAHCTRPLR
jgi:hypothetical protein